MSRDAVIAVARGELGQPESPPGSNRVKYWEVMPAWNGQPWCVVFLLWCFRKAGEAMAFFGGAFTASCSTLWAWYKSQGQTVPVEEAQPGDIALLNFNGGKSPEHCGLVKKVHYLGAGTVLQIETIEGNTSVSGSQSNGGMVCEKVRYPTQFVAVCRPMYSEPEPEPVDDITGHWAEESIRWCIEHGLMQGYEDGSFKPERAVTRAELATILKRLKG